MNKIAVLDPNATMVDPRTGAVVMKEVLTTAGVTPGKWAAADSGVIKINGAVAPNSNSNSYTNLTLVTINTGFIAGVNTLDFVITSPSSPTGVRVDSAVPRH